LQRFGVPHEVLTHIQVVHWPVRQARPGEVMFERICREERHHPDTNPLADHHRHGGASPTVDFVPASAAPGRGAVAAAAGRCGAEPGAVRRRRQGAGSHGDRATGFRSDYSWIHVPGVHTDGRVAHRRGVTEVPGLYFLGLSWQHTRGSALLGFVGDDAGYLADRIAAGQQAVTAATVSTGRPTSP
jgi:hypothetical protein